MLSLAPPPLEAKRAVMDFDFRASPVNSPVSEMSAWGSMGIHNVFVAPPLMMLTSAGRSVRVASGIAYGRCPPRPLAPLMVFQHVQGLIPAIE